ncbi:hypothetical protein [Methylobacterium nodulans]|uniref:Uncharacterized protein n=1 Tax=Methylobacterium nodulans (strain LMG 21967 / CNCM I-2342 / ORS 2060) TaxID=460265 RepID=B8IT71_METNO|nr:hypothetical protein [Methylobacterium nodulans]ACL56957.1 hypothetical protein Mnod_1969 [Methylobacterium nodulans ORS 2060]
MTVRASLPAPTPGVRGITVLLLGDGTEIHVDDIATAEQGRSLLDRLDQEIASIEDQISAAVLRGSADPSWRRRAEIALKRKRRIRPRLQERIDELRRAEQAVRAEANRVADRAAIDGQRRAVMIAARELLGHEIMTEIWARAAELRPACFREGVSEDAA